MDPDKKWKLSPALESRCPVELRAALDHPLRRQILRLLSDNCSLAMPALSQACEGSRPLAEISYHALRLVDAGAVSMVRQHDAHTAARRFRSLLIAEDSVVLILAATREADQQILAQFNFPSPRR